MRKQFEVDGAGWVLGDSELPLAHGLPLALPAAPPMDEQANGFDGFDRGGQRRPLAWQAVH
eukprot:186581-Pyramimonas_sp.AAC.1